jgi:hypothetical protein
VTGSRESKGVAWEQELTALIAEYEKLGPSPAPFELRSGCSVINPTLFHEALKREIEGGPGGARAKMGGLKDDLEDYLKFRRTEL